MQTTSRPNSTHSRGCQTAEQHRCSGASGCRSFCAVHPWRRAPSAAEPAWVQACWRRTRSAARGQAAAGTPPPLQRRHGAGRSSCTLPGAALTCSVAGVGVRAGRRNWVLYTQNLRPQRGGTRRASAEADNDAADRMAAKSGAPRLKSWAAPPVERLQQREHGEQVCGGGGGAQGGEVRRRQHLGEGSPGGLPPLHAARPRRHSRTPAAGRRRHLPAA